MARKDSRGRNLNTGESQRKDGVYMYRYTNPKTGARIATYAPTLAKLREKEREIVRDLDAGLTVDKNTKMMTVNELFEHYLDSKQQIKESSRWDYIAMWNRFIRDGLGSMKVVQVKTSDIKLLYTKLAKANYAQKTIRLLNSILLPCFEMALDDSIILKNPVRKAAKDIGGRPPQEKKALSILQQDKLLEFVKHSKSYQWFYPVIAVMLCTGCRCGEIIGLTWDDIDLEKGIISINHQLTYKNFGDGFRFYVTQPKTSSGIRNIPIFEPIRNVLLKLQHETQCNFVIGDYTGFVFATKKGDPLRADIVNRALCGIVRSYNMNENKMAQEEGREAELMPHISAHTMRHTACSRMVESKLDLKVIQYIMGHSNTQMIMEIYAHITDQARIVSEMAKLEGVFTV